MQLALFARGALSYRLVALSTDEGKTFGPTRTLSLREPLEGCEGSTIRLPGSDWLLYSGPVSTSVLRLNMTIFLSKDGGQQWVPWQLVYVGPAAYSALAVLPDGRFVHMCDYVCSWICVCF